MSKKPTISDVIVHKGEPNDGNPFRGSTPGTIWPCTSAIGEERVKALTALKHGAATAGYTFWDLRRPPFCRHINGEIERRITEAEHIDWETSGIE